MPGDGGKQIGIGEQNAGQNVNNYFAPAARPGESTNFPAASVSRNSNFVGRTKELADLHAKLAGGDVAVFHAVTADGGFGKSQLAIEYAYVYAAEYTGRWFITAATPATADADGRSILTALGETPPQESDAVAARVSQLLSQSRHLLILDDVQDLAEAKRRYALSAPARLLATTRRRVLPRSGFVPLQLDVLTTQDAVDLLRKGRAELCAPEHETSLARIAERLHYHALAVSLAGAYFDKYPGVFPDELLRRLENAPVGTDADLLATVDPSEVDARFRRGVAETLLLHVPTLGEPTDETETRTQTLLAAASLIAPRAIPPSLLLEAAGATVNDAALDPLVSVSILRYGEAKDAAMLSIHGLSQQVVIVRLLATEQGQRIVTTAAFTLLAVLLNAFSEEALERPEHWTSLDYLSPHAETLVRTHLAGFEHWGVALLLIRAGTFALEARFRAEDASAMFVEAERILRTADGDHRSLLANCVGQIGTTLMGRGDLDGALQKLTESERLHQMAHGDGHPDVASAANNIAYVLMQRGDRSAALVKYKEAERIHRAAHGDDHPSVATVVNNIGYLLQGYGDLDAALAKFAEAERINRAAYGDRHPKVAIDVNNIGTILKERGAFAGARAKYQEALDIFLEAYAGRGEQVLTAAANLVAVGGDPVGHARQIGGDAMAAELLEALREYLAAKGRLDLLPPGGG